MQVPPTHPDAAEPLDIRSLRAVDVLARMPDGVYVTDTQRRIVFWNEAAEAITGWPREHVIGTSCRDNLLVHIDKDGRALCGEAFCPLSRAMATGRGMAVPILVYAQHRDGRRIPVEISVAPLRNAAGTIIGGIEVFRDAVDLHEGMRAAGVLQRHALESHLPEDPRLLVRMRNTPLDLVGGDFMRVARIDEHRYAAMVADVMGHGLPGALFTMQLRVLWDELSPLLPTPGVFFARLNARLRVLAGRDSYFATACFALVDLQAGQLTMAAAGHPPALLRRANGDFTDLPPGGAALGLLADAVYTTCTEPFAPGDAVLLFTDGAIEATNPQEEELGPEGLIALWRELTPIGLPDFDRLERTLLLRSNQIRLEDDLTLVGLARPPGA